VQVRADITYTSDPGGIGIDGLPRPASPIQTGAKDDQWIPIVASQGWIVITKDRHMRTRPHEVKLIRTSAARHVRLIGPTRKHNMTKWEQLQLVASRWEAIESLLGAPGPWIYALSRTNLRREL
jgi:PIN like domain